MGNCISNYKTSEEIQIERIKKFIRTHQINVYIPHGYYIKKKVLVNFHCF